MTLTQYRRLCVFALRMVPISIGGKRWQNEVREHVRELLYRMNRENWDFHWSHILDWDNCEMLDEEERRRSFGLYKAALPCDYISEYLFDEGLEDERGEYKGKVGCAVSCCIRAALDVAVSPSAGVLGYTVDDLRLMWAPKPIPAWVEGFFEEPLAHATGKEAVWL